MLSVADLIGTLIRLFALGLFIRILLDWLDVAEARPVRKFLNRLYDPFLSPIRRRLRPVKLSPSAPEGVDLSPAILLLLIWLVAAPLLGWIFGG